MDFTPLFAAALGGAIALSTQISAARANLRLAQRQIDYGRWEPWRRESADVWADLMAGVRAFDRSFDDLAAQSDDELREMRQTTEKLVHGLDRLSVLTLDARVGNWSSQLARLFTSLQAAMPTHHGCDDEANAEEFQRHRHLLHAQFDWNDGDRSTQLDRLRDALRTSTDPPVASRATRIGRRSRRRARLRGAIAR